MESSALALARELLSDRERGVLRADGSVNDHQDATLYVVCTNVLTPSQCARVARDVAAGESHGVDGAQHATQDSHLTLCGKGLDQLSNFASGAFVRAACASMQTGEDPEVEVLRAAQPLSSGQDPRAAAPDAEVPSLWEGWTGAAVILPLVVMIVLALGAWWVLATSTKASSDDFVSPTPSTLASATGPRPRRRPGGRRLG